MKTKKPELLGIWAEITELLPLGEVANLLGVSVEDFSLMAINQKPVTPSVAAAMRSLCLLHGVKPSLYVYSNWSTHRDIVTCSSWDGWQTWHLKAGYRQTRASITTIPASLKPCDEITLALARRHGYPF